MKKTIKISDLENKVLSAANQWLVDRSPKDPLEKALAAAIARAWPEELGSRETCKCDDSANCDECPTAAEVEAMIFRWEREAAPSPQVTAEGGDHG